jgi:hypothetical protein
LTGAGCTTRSGIPDDRDADGQWKRAEKQARSIKYQLTVAKLPLAKDVDNAAGAVREKWNLPFNYPMVAPNYAAQRSALVKQIGLGQIRRKGVVARVPAVVERGDVAIVGVVSRILGTGLPMSSSRP